MPFVFNWRMLRVVSVGAGLLTVGVSIKGAGLLTVRFSMSGGGLMTWGLPMSGGGLVVGGLTVGGVTGGLAVWVAVREWPLVCVAVLVSAE